MTTGSNGLSEREELETLLPWYVLGRLDAADRARVEAWLGRDADAARLITLIREEQQAAVELNTAARIPASLTVERTMAHVVPKRSSPAHAEGNTWWIGLRDLFTLPTPGAVRLAAGAAAIVILLQGIAIGTLWRHTPAVYETASGQSTASGAAGSFALAKFADAVTAQQMAKELGALGISIVDGPKPGGLYRVQIAPGRLSDTERDERILQLRRETGLFVLLTPAP